MHTVRLVDNGVIQLYEADNIEMLAGMLAAGMSDALPEGAYLESDTDVSEYRLIADLSQADIPYVGGDVLREGYYGIWLSHGRGFNYSLYTFKTMEFIRGVMACCAFYEYDFLSIIRGYIFDNDNMIYILQGEGMLIDPYYMVLKEEDDDYSDDENHMMYNHDMQFYDEE